MAFGFHPNVRFGIDTSVELFSSTLKPFVGSLAAAIASHGRLDAALAEVGRQRAEWPYFFNMETESFGLKEQFLYPATNPLARMLVVSPMGRTVVFDLADADQKTVTDLGTLLAACGHGKASREALRRSTPDSVLKVFDDLTQVDCVVSSRKRLSAVLKSVPGIYRLQHASLLYRGRDTGVIVDPQLLSLSSNASADFSVSELISLVDAILISHSHTDHYNISSLLMFPRNIPIIVPRVLRRTLICDDLASRLRSFGFTRVVEVPWYAEPIRIGEFSIHVLPFYGEQPLLREPPRFEDLLNNGNTYLLEWDSQTSWFLIDSGNEHRGRMSDVAKYVRREFGQVDTIISNLRRFTMFSPFYITGTGTYWLCLSPSQIERFANYKTDAITLGIEGVAEICSIVSPTYCLPYAHWWDAIGSSPSEESAMTSLLSVEIRRQGGRTQVLDWHIGSLLRRQRGGIAVCGGLRD